MPSRSRALKDVLWTLALVGLVAGVFRMWFGLGATTNMSDAVPWGLWKVFNMVAGVALSTSGFTIGFLVYVLRLEQFRKYVKPAILLAFLGYGCSMLALLFDIGLPHRFWHPMFMWNEHSFLFEVFWCVLLYFTITLIELSPSVLEQTRAHRVGRWLHRFAFGVVIVGISLSSLHHSSLGSLFLVSPVRLHELWYTSWLPLLFIVSAMGAGMMVLILVRILYARLYDPEPVFGAAASGINGIVCQIPGISVDSGGVPARGPEMARLSKLALIAASLLGATLALKVIDLARRGAWTAVGHGQWESWLFGVELLVGLVLPIVLVAIPRTRRSPYGLGVASVSAAAGLAINRLNVGIFGYLRDAGSFYIPSLTEWALSIGVVAAAGLAFLFFVENVSIFDQERVVAGQPGESLTALFERWSHVWYAALMSGVHRVTLIAVLVIPLAWVMLYPPYSDDDVPTVPVQAATGLDINRATLLLDGDREGVDVTFAHLDHQNRLGKDSACHLCHHVSTPMDRSTPCSRCHRDMLSATPIFDHAHHEQAVVEKERLTSWHATNRTCGYCHPADQAKTSDNAKNCFECHKTDMWLTSTPDSTINLSEACAFREAMHRTCIPCHKEKAQEAAKPNLAECFTCHVTMTPRRTAPTPLITFQNNAVMPHSN